jgi:glycosyltransferase involved in cell wall biosynthesis
LVITNNLSQASFRLRVQQIIPLLRERGIEMEVQVRPRRVIPRRRLLRRAADYDSVLLQRKLLDPMDARLLRREARQIFYDIDDAVMLEQRPMGAIARWRNQRRFEATADAADHVVAGNEYLADFFRRRGRPVTVLPTVVDPAHYAVKRHDDTRSPRLVWIGSHSTIPYLQRFVPAIEAAAARANGLGLITIADAGLEKVSFPVEHIPWSAETEAAALVRGDIGIAPTPDDPWTRGKCGFKIVQYMAAGLPVIASPVGANAAIVTPECGILADSPEQWTAAIIQLAADAKLRATMGAAGRKRVESQYSLARAVDVWAQLLR